MDEPLFPWPLSTAASDETFFDLEVTFSRVPEVAERIAFARALAEVEHRGGISVRPSGLRVGWHESTMRIQLEDERRSFDPAEAATRSLIRRLHALLPIQRVEDVAVATLSFDADPTFDDAYFRARRELENAPQTARAQTPGLQIEELVDGVPPGASPLEPGEVDTPRGRCRCLKDRLEWHRDGEVFGLRFPKPNLRNLFALVDGSAVIAFLGGADFTILACRPDAVVMVGVCPSGAVVPDYNTPLHRDGARLIVMRDEDDYADEAVELVGVEGAVEAALADGAPLENNAWVDLESAFQIDLPL